MFLRDDYPLMLENSLALAKQYHDWADVYAEKADSTTGDDRQMLLNNATTYRNRAVQHEQDAEYWMTVIAQYEEPANVE